MTDVSEALTVYIALSMEAVNTSETSVTFYEIILRYILEDSHLHVFHLLAYITDFETGV
jgi:hypothetical protein